MIISEELSSDKKDCIVVPLHVYPCSVRTLHVLSCRSSDKKNMYSTCALRRFYVYKVYKKMFFVLAVDRVFIRAAVQSQNIDLSWTLLVSLRHSFTT
jgi:hypothetical protein